MPVVYKEKEKEAGLTKTGNTFTGKCHQNKCLHFRLQIYDFWWTVALSCEEWCTYDIDSWFIDQQVSTLFLALICVKYYSFWIQYLFFPKLACYICCAQSFDNIFEADWCVISTIVYCCVTLLCFSAFFSCIVYILDTAYNILSLTWWMIHFVKS